MGWYQYRYRKYRHIGTFFRIGSIGIGNRKMLLFPAVSVSAISAYRQRSISGYRRIGGNMVSAHPYLISTEEIGISIGASHAKTSFLYGSKWPNGTPWEVSHWLGISKHAHWVAMFLHSMLNHASANVRKASGFVLTKEVNVFYWECDYWSEPPSYRPLLAWHDWYLQKGLGFHNVIEAESQGSTSLTAQLLGGILILSHREGNVCDRARNVSIQDLREVFYGIKPPQLLFSLAEFFAPNSIWDFWS